MKRTLTVAAALAVAAIQPAYAQTIFGVDSGNRLVSFNATAPGTYTSSVALTGLTGGVLGLDFRSSNNMLYALGADRRIYTINTVSGFATALSADPLAINGDAFGFDFNPVADAIRIVSNTNENYRVNPNTGVLIAQDTSVFYPGSTQDPDVIANAYVTGTTTQYAIDAAAGTLVRQNNNAGDLTTIGSLGVNVGLNTSFDILNSDAFVYSGQTLYRANLATGALTDIGVTRTQLFGIAIQAAVPEPATWGTMLAGFFGMGALMRRRRRPVAATA